MNEQELLEAYKEKCPHAWKILEESIRAEERQKFASMLPNAFCQYCNQEGCEGGMVGSIQECETIRMLKDVIKEVKEEMKGE